MKNYFRIPTSDGPHCGVCGGVPPTNHYPDCPIKTGEPVEGAQALQGVNPGLQGIDPFGAQIQGIPLEIQNQLAQQQAAQNEMAGIGIFECEFIGGPLDGRNPVHPAQNSILHIAGDQTGYYRMSFGRYYWIRK